MKWAALLVLPLVSFAGCVEPAADAPALIHELLCLASCEAAVAEGGHWFEPDVAVNPLDPDHVVAVSSFFPDPARRWNMIHVSRNAGTSWQTAAMPGGPGGDPLHPLAACTTLFDAVVTFLADGTLLVGGVGSAGVHKDWFVARSSDGGASFDGVSVPQAIDDRACMGLRQQGTCLGICVGRARTFADKPYLAAGPDGEAFASFAPGTRFMKSHDGGAMWSHVPPILPWIEGASPYSASMAVDDEGTLHAAFAHVVSENDSWRIGMVGYGALATGGTWQTELISEDASGYATIRFDDGHLWLSYPRSEGGMETPVVRIHENGAWGPEIALDSPETEGAIVPTLAVSNGIAYSGFYHQRPDGSNDYRVAATDGHAVASEIVSASPIGRQTLGVELGHYMGLAASNGVAHAIWISGENPETRIHHAATTWAPQP